PHRAVLTPHYDDALAPDRAAHVITRVGDLGFPSDAHPTSREDALLLLREHLGRVVITARQRALALLIRLGGFDERRHGVKAIQPRARMPLPAARARARQRARRARTQSRPRAPSPTDSSRAPRGVPRRTAPHRPAPRRTGSRTRAGNRVRNWVTAP